MCSIHKNEKLFKPQVQTFYKSVNEHINSQTPKLSVRKAVPSVYCVSKYPPLQAFCRVSCFFLFHMVVAFLIPSCHFFHISESINILRMQLGNPFTSRNVRTSHFTVFLNCFRVILQNSFHLCLSYKV